MQYSSESGSQYSGSQRIQIVEVLMPRVRYRARCWRTIGSGRGWHSESNALSLPVRTRRRVVGASVAFGPEQVIERRATVKRIAAPLEQYSYEFVDSIWSV